MKVLVTGASGVLGIAICPVLTKKGYSVHATSRRGEANEIDKLDVTNYTQVREAFDRIKPELVIHMAAETDVDRCEIEPDHAFKTNTIGTLHVASCCSSYDSTMVYVSAACVFDGMGKDVHTEFDQPNPLSIYAKSKFEGEKVVQSILNRYFIVRPGWVIGGGVKDKKFVAKIVAQLTKTNELKAVSDKLGTPTYNRDFADCLSALIETDLYGLYHMGNIGYCSRYQMAKKIVEILGRDDVHIEAVTSEKFNLPGPRPRSESIRNYKLELLGMNSMQTWESALKEYIERDFAEAIKR